MSSSRQLFLVVAAFSLAVACGSGGGGEPGPTPTSMVRVAASDSQVGPAGQALGTALQVVVRDQDSSVMAGVSVNWAVASGGGSVAPTTSTTDINGIASTTRTLGPNAGVQTATASRSGLPTRTFTSFAQIQGATQIQANGGSPQTDTVLSTLATPLSVLVRNHLNAPVAGVIINFAAAGGDTINGGTAAVDTTDGAGIASVVRKLGPATGTRAVTATVTGLIGSPVSFTATATAGVATTFQKTGGTGGDGQNGTLSAPLAQPYSVTVRDGHGNGRPGIVVNWAPIGGGSVNPAVDTTDQNGVSTSRRTLGPTVGEDTTLATSPTFVNDTLLFTATVSAAAATADVSVLNFQFDPTGVTIAAGGTVTWTWSSGMTNHNVTWDSGAPTEGNIGNRNSGSILRTFPNAGTYTYQCSLHPGQMSGTVNVVP